MSGDTAWLDMTFRAVDILAYLILGALGVGLATGYIRIERRK